MTNDTRERLRREFQRFEQRAAKAEDYGLLEFLCEVEVRLLWPSLSSDLDHQREARHHNRATYVNDEAWETQKQRAADGTLANYLP